eukprot:m.1447573 g.1447573  ORF g.1447573 m.1447573 type:complete len:1842 (+) comp25108_c0_seq1:189-5714(+)
MLASFANILLATSVLSAVHLTSGGDSVTQGWARTLAGYVFNPIDGPRTEGNLSPSLVPPMIDFDLQPLCQPRRQRVTLVNEDSQKPLTVYSITSPSDDVQCTWLDDSAEVVEAGKNATFTVVHLGYSIGQDGTSVLLSTSHGDVSLSVTTSNTVNMLRTRPLIDGEVAVGVPYVQPIRVYNPFDTPLRVVEVYTSNSILSLEPVPEAVLATTEAARDHNKSGRVSHFASQTIDANAWVLQPQSYKTVMVLRTSSKQTGMIQGYVHVRTNVTDANAVISVKVSISDVPGLYYGPGDSLDFGTTTVRDEPVVQSIPILSNTNHVLRVLEARIVDCKNLLAPSESTCPDVVVTMKRLSGMMQPNAFTDVAQAVMSPAANQKAGYFKGYVQFDYSNLDDAQFQLRIPFYAHVLQGSLEFTSDETHALNTAFYTGPEMRSPQRASVQIFNGFEQKVSLLDISIPQNYSGLFKIEDFTPQTLGSNATASFDVLFNGSVPDLMVSTQIDVVTNISRIPYNIPLHAYTGHLDVVTGTDNLGGAAIDLGRIHLGVRYSSQVLLVNRNPVDVVLMYYVSKLAPVTVALVSANDSAIHNVRSQIGALNASENGRSTTRRFRGTHLQQNSLSKTDSDFPTDAEVVNMVLEPGMRVVFSVGVFVSKKTRVNAPDGLEFVTSFQRLRVPIAFHAKQHLLHITPKSLSFAPTLPGVFLGSPRALTDDSNINVDDAERRARDSVKYLLPLEELHIQMSPYDRLSEITRVHSDDARFVVRPLMAAAGGGSKASNDPAALVNLSAVVFDPTRGPWAENYVPQFGAEASAMPGLPLLTQDTIREAKRAKEAWATLVKKNKCTIRSRIHVESASEKAEVIDVRARLDDMDLGLPATVTFPLTQVRHVAREELIFTNPTQYPMLVGLESLDVYRNNPIVNSLVDLLDLSQSDIDAAMASRAMFNATLGGAVVRGEDSMLQATVVEPYGRVSLSVEFHPDMAGSLTSAFLIRNNLTLVQALSVTGEAGRGTFGFPKNQSYIVDGSLSFPITATNLSYCRLAKRMSRRDAVRAFVFNVTVVNRGNMPVRVERMSLGGTGACAAGGFSLDSCDPFVLRTKQFKTFSITVQPDFTTATMTQSLVVQLEGLDRPMRFNMEALLPRGAVKVCSDALPGPVWETTFRATAVVTMVTLAVLLGVGEYTAGGWHHPQRFQARPRTRTTSQQLTPTPTVAPVVRPASPPASAASNPLKTPAAVLVKPHRDTAETPRAVEGLADPISNGEGADGGVVPAKAKILQPMVTARTATAPSKKKTKKQQVQQRKETSTPTLDVEWESVGKHSKKSGRNAAGTSARSSPAPLPPTPPVELGEKEGVERKKSKGVATPTKSPATSSVTVDPPPVTVQPAVGCVVPTSTRLSEGTNAPDAASIRPTTAETPAQSVASSSANKDTSTNKAKGGSKVSSTAVPSGKSEDLAADGRGRDRAAVIRKPESTPAVVSNNTKSTTTTVMPSTGSAPGGDGRASGVRPLLGASPLGQRRDAPTAPTELFQNLPKAMPTLTDLSAYGVVPTTTAAVSGPMDNLPRGTAAPSSAPQPGMDLWMQYDALSGGGTLAAAAAATTPFTATGIPRSSVAAVGGLSEGVRPRSHDWSAGDAQMGFVGGAMPEMHAGGIGRAGSDNGNGTDLHRATVLRSDSDGANDAFNRTFSRNANDGGFATAYGGAPDPVRSATHSRPPGLPSNADWSYRTGKTAPYSPQRDALRHGLAGNGPSESSQGEVHWSTSTTYDRFSAPGSGRSSSPAPTVLSAPSSPPTMPRQSQAVASGLLPSIPYTGIGIWASGSGDFGELEWAKAEQKKGEINPDAQEWSGW